MQFLTFEGGERLFKGVDFVVELTEIVLERVDVGRVLSSVFLDESL